tara:strand:+ start:907 stop:1590 length:684 start_codon:yes stop_codon:yes gene_type:complete
MHYRSLSLVAVFLLAGCSGNATSGNAASGNATSGDAGSSGAASGGAASGDAGSGVAAGGDAASVDAGSGSSRKRSASSKDRGEAAMMLGATQWTADRVKAKLRNSSLTIKASNTERVDGKMTRQELTLVVSDYKGPGDYKTGAMGSRFIGVGVDMDAAKAAGDGEAATRKTLTDVLSDAKHLMLMSAQVTIATASDTEITGSFSWQPPKGMDKPAIKNGTFRALLSQ